MVSIKQSAAGESSTLATHSDDNAEKRSWKTRVEARLPTLDAFRKTTKVSIALLIGVILNMHDATRRAIGSGSLFVIICAIFYFPSRPIGVELEGIIYGTAGALLAAAWSTLGMFLADLARDPAVKIPIQASSSAVLAVFLFSGTFVVNYVRMYFPKANFACIFACITLTITLTNASAIPGFQPAIMYAILTPIAVGTAVALAVTVFLWPQDTITGFLNVLSLSLNEYNEFFKEQSDAFLTCTKSPVELSLTHLRNCMQGSVLLLIDCKRAVQREVLFTYLSAKDCSSITRRVKEMRSPLHGIGFAVLKKKQGLMHCDADEQAGDITYKVTSEECKAFLNALETLVPLYSEMGSLCYKILAATSRRFAQFGNSPRSTISTFFWPFMRVNLFNRIKQKTSKPRTVNDLDIEDNKEEAQDDSDLSFKNDMDRLAELISTMETTATGGMIGFLEAIHKQEDKDPRYDLLYVLFCYQMNLKAHSENVIAMARELIKLQHERTVKQLWLPSLTLKKWFRRSEGDQDIGSGNVTTTSPSDHGLLRTRTRPDDLDNDDMASPYDPDRNKSKYNQASKRKRYLPLDPDIYPPATKAERFFYGLYLLKEWCLSINTFFAFKTAVAVVLLSIPAFRVESAGWFNQWKGQWAQISLVLWLFPMAGLFYSSMILRLLGTIVGGVLGIIVWEISRGNPYGISCLCFLCFMILIHTFLNGPLYMKPIAMLTIVTMMLVIIYEYQYVRDQVPNYDQVYILAGKRVLLVIIGLVAATIVNMIPNQVTGRVELRKRLALTITQIGRMYSLLTSAYMVQHEEPPTENQKKAFRKLTLDVQRQLADERTLLFNAKFEPPLRGKFPFKGYAALLQNVENMTDLIDAMVYAAKSIDTDWRDHITNILLKERKDYLSSIMVSLKLTSGALSSKMTYPPFMVTPVDARMKFSNAAEKKMRIQRRDLNVSTLSNFAAFGVYLLAASNFVTEVQEMMDTVTEMVGVDDPSIWRERNK